jgi:HEAT repeat protein
MSPEYIKKWVGYLDDIDADMSRIACEKLAKTRDPSVVPELAKALHNRPLDVRAAAARALGEIGHPSGVPALIEALRDLEPGVSSAAADALGVIGDASAVPALRQVLHDYKTGINRYNQLHGDFRGLYVAAVQALRQIGTREAQAAIAKYDSW